MLSVQTLAIFLYSDAIHFYYIYTSHLHVIIQIENCKLRMTQGSVFGIKFTKMHVENSPVPRPSQYPVFDHLATVHTHTHTQKKTTYCMQLKN